MRLEHIIEIDLGGAIKHNRAAKVAVLSVLIHNIEKLDEPHTENIYELIRDMILERKAFINEFSGKGVSKKVMKKALEIMYLDYYLPESML